MCLKLEIRDANGKVLEIVTKLEVGDFVFVVWR